MTERLIQTALEMRDRAYCPYSGFAVGAAVLTAEGKIFGGANIEISALSSGICAERSAIFKAVSEGERHFTAIAIAGGEKDKAISDYCSPCGVCRQVLSEFSDGSLQIILIKSEKDYKIYTLSELLPLAYRDKV